MEKQKETCVTKRATAKTFNSRVFAAPGCTCYFHLHRSCWSCCDYHLTHHLRLFIAYRLQRLKIEGLTSAGTCNWFRTDAKSFQKKLWSYDHYDQWCAYLMMKDYWSTWRFTCTLCKEQHSFTKANQGKHVSSVFFSMYPALYTGSMPTRIPPHAYADGKGCLRPRFLILGAYAGASAGFFVGWPCSW